MPASAADDASYAARYLPAADVAAGACGIAPHAYADLGLGVSYSGKSDVSDSGRAPEASRSPAVPRRSRSMFSSDDESDYPSPRSARGSYHERVDDGASRRHTEDRNTGKFTTLKRDVLMPWRLPE